jgi:hypothetical protein
MILVALLVVKHFVVNVLRIGLRQKKVLVLIAGRLYQPTLSTKFHVLYKIC